MLERSPDVLDNASNLSESERASLEAAQRRKAVPKQVKDASGKWPQLDCEECGDPIGYKRLEAVGAVTCIHCETLKERERKLHGKS